MISPNSFQTYSLKKNERGNQICRILAASLEAVDPLKAVCSALRRDKNALIADGVLYDLTKYQRILTVGIGKACVPMLRAVVNTLNYEGIIGVGITKDGYVSNEEIDEFRKYNINILEAGHPLPDKRSIHAARQVCDLLKGCREDDLVIVAISGGGSALFTAPAESISLSDLSNLNQSLIKSGANIHEINAIRKHIDVVKGGGLAKLAYPATMITLILSDVVGDELDVIASGPTVPDLSTFIDAQITMHKISGKYPIPESICRRIEDGASGKIPENPKPGEDIFKKVQNVLVGSNRMAAQAGLEQARQEGFSTLLLTTFLQGEAREVGRWLGAIAKEIELSGHPIEKPACIVAGGETTVTIHGDGMGGRNQEVALGSVEVIAGLTGVYVITLATDGGDGNSEAAGAVVNGETYHRAASLGMNVGDYLQRNDSYHLFLSLDDILRPGPTQTNVNDLSFIFVI